MTTHLTPDIASEVAAACQAGAAEAAAALGRALDVTLEMTPGEVEAYSGAAPAQAGLVVVFEQGSAAAILLLPEVEGFLPSWCREPDASGSSKLDTLAKELGALLLPESCTPEGARAGFVANLNEACGRAKVAEGAASLELKIKTAEGVEAPLCLIWPAESPSEVLASAPDAGGGAAAPDSAPAAAPAAPAPAKAATPKATTAAPRKIPTYMQSLLRIQVPMNVTLATKRQPVKQIVELGPGSILQFDKSCEQPLALCINDTPVALGEAVKVGEKFGIRITSMVMPHERFRAIHPGRT